MKEYKEPVLEIIELTDDVIATSGCKYDTCPTDTCSGNCSPDCGYICQGDCKIVNP